MMKGSGTVFRTYKFRIYPTKVQRIELEKHLRASAEIWNQMLAFFKYMQKEYDTRPTSETLYQMTRGNGAKRGHGLLYSQVVQNIVRRLERGFREIDISSGKHTPRYRKIAKSITYPQVGKYGAWVLDKNIDVTPFGIINTVKHREIKGTARTLTIKKTRAERWFAAITTEDQPRTVIVKQKIGQVGIDLGLKKFATLSDGSIVRNPRHIEIYEQSIARRQRKLSRTKSGTNHQKARIAIARLYAKISNIRNNFLHQLSFNLVQKYSLIALEDLTTYKMISNQYGRQIKDAGWRMFSDMIDYKAESAGCQIVFVNPAWTTSTCSACGLRVKKKLVERIHICKCGSNIDRDLNAAKNILIRATAGLAGSNACGDGKPSLNQEPGSGSHNFSYLG